MSSDLVLLKRTFDPAEAHIIRGLLESNDIPAFVMDDQHSTVAWHLQIALGGSRIMVLHQDLEKARELIGEQLQNAPQPLERRKNNFLDNLIQIGVFFGTGVPFVLRKRYKDTENTEKK